MGLRGNLKGDTEAAKRIIDLQISTIGDKNFVGGS
jgi:hypothetical protein